MVSAETIVFSILFISQTIIYLFLLRKLMTSHDATAKTEETNEEELDFRANHDGLTIPNAAIEALKLLREKQEGMTSTEISKTLGRSREHVARAMKILYIKGLVDRQGKPFRYHITERGSRYLDVMENHTED